ncbi:DUF7683 domain-containing protein [Enterobacter mori]|uniref:DUF7683 domain-containing protein n=1 Tax=Enterobacter mori TaxID=539813 RepID=UPI001B8B6A1F|nr:hypothetical protein [Enterobacter mori]MBS3049681.1 hypothetical protein [Enterobacter mori]
MIVYSIDVYNKTDELLLYEIVISQRNLAELLQVMGISDEDKDDFTHGIGVYNINERQAHLLEKIIGRTFYSNDLIFQLSGGEL